jgi:hypothetical protein
MKIRKGRFSGRIGEEVYVNSKYGQVVRSRSRRPWRPTAGRLAVQHNLGKVVNAWRNLTPKQFEAWTAAARKEHMKPYPFFSKINGALAAAKLPLLMDPPKREKLRPNSVGELEILNRGGVITLRLRVPRAPAQHTFVLGSKRCRRGIWTRGNKFAIIGELPMATGGRSASHLITSPYKARPGLSLLPVEWLLGLSLRDQALDGAPAVPVCPFPAARRPIRSQLGALNNRAFWPPTTPTLPQTVLGASPEPHRSTSVPGTEVLR